MDFDTACVANFKIRMVASCIDLAWQCMNKTTHSGRVVFCGERAAPVVYQADAVCRDSVDVPPGHDFFHAVINRGSEWVREESLRSACGKGRVFPAPCEITCALTTRHYRHLLRRRAG